MINSKTTPQQLNQFAKDSMTNYLGIEVTEVTSDYLIGKMPVDQRTIQAHGILHGGASVTLAETLSSIGATLSVDQNQFMCVGMEINANHIKSVKSGYVYGKASPIHIGSKSHVWETKITNEADQLICISRITMAVIEKRSK